MLNSSGKETKKMELPPHKEKDHVSPCLVCVGGEEEKKKEKVFLISL